MPSSVPGAGAEAVNSLPRSQLALPGLITTSDLAGASQLIILDTGILRGTSLESAPMEMLSTLRKSGTETVAITSVTLEELVAQRAISYEEKYLRAYEAVDALHGVTPWAFELELPPLDLDAFRTSWRKFYRELFVVLPTSGAVLQEAMFREANLIAPCKEHKGQKIGSRDAAIWLAAAEFARENPSEQVYFVSGNTKDFGTATERDDVLDDDVYDLGSRFVHRTNLDDVFADFTRPAEVPDEEYHRVLSSPVQLVDENANALEDLLPWGMPVRDLADWSARGVFGFEDSYMPPTAYFLDYTDASAHQLGTDVWCTATVRYLLCAMYADGTTVAGVNVWTARMAASLSEKDQQATVLRNMHVTHPGPDDMQAVPDTVLDMWRHAAQLHRQGEEPSAREMGSFALFHASQTQALSPAEESIRRHITSRR
ncbi:PIN domain-containing protein [Streptomyces sp. BH104]|uniref:PIN domain-containing protein n=1 Tax=Streptomyces sp. BH104 TaxID=3410407 RepID=UPI003BB77768